MKILRISQTYPTMENNGKGLHAFNYSKNIKYPTVVLTKYYNENYFRSENHIKLVPIKYWQFPFRKGKQIINLLALFSFFVGQTVLFFKSIIIVIKFKPTVVHSQSPHSFIIAFFSKFFFKSKIFLTFHGSDLKRLKSKKFFMKTLNYYNKIFYVSEQMEKSLMSYYSINKLFYTPSGLNRDFFLKKPVKISPKNQFLATGNVRWQKDYLTMIKAFNIFKKNNENFKLVIIGDTKEKKIFHELNDLINQYNLENHIIFKGLCSHSDVKKEMYNSKALLMSSISEGMPKVIHEAKCCGIPIISTDVGSCKKLIGKFGYTFEPGDFIKMSEHMKEILNLKLDINEIKDSTRKYCWKNLSSRIEKVFSEEINIK